MAQIDTGMAKWVLMRRSATWLFERGWKWVAPAMPPVRLVNPRGVVFRFKRNCAGVWLKRTTDWNE